MSRVEKAYTEEEPTTPKRNATLDYKAGSNYIEVIGRVSHKMRRLHFVIDGDVDKLHELPVVFWFHGMFDYSASFVHRQYGILGRSVGAPLPPTDWVAVALDRPGYGSSTGSWATKEWTYEDFARDVEAVADAIGVERFYVSGHSSGGPCALACAAHIPERIIGAGVMAGDCEYAEEGAPQLGQFPEGCAFVFGRYIMCGQHRGFEGDFFDPDDDDTLDKNLVQKLLSNLDQKTRQGKDQ